MGACRRAFSTIEYAVLIAIVAAALIAACVYMKRALSGKWREAADTFGHGRQYAKGAASPVALPNTPPTSYPCVTTFYQSCKWYSLSSDGNTAFVNYIFHFDIGKDEPKVNIKWHYSDGTKDYNIDFGNFEPGRYRKSVQVAALRVLEDWLIKSVGNTVKKITDYNHGPESNRITSYWCDPVHAGIWDDDWYKPLCE